MTGDVLGRVFDTLDRLGVPYMLTGSFANNYYAEPRSTHDADIVIRLQTGSSAAIARELGDDFVASESSPSQQFNVIHVATSFKIDFWPLKNIPFDQSMFARRRAVSLFGRQVPIPSPEDLLIQKLRWAQETGSEQQKRDVAALLRAQGSVLNWSYLARWAATLNIQEQLDNLRSKPGSS